MNEEAVYSLEKFERAMARLAEGAAGAEKELEKDGVIQRFEFTFEAFWKCLKIILEERGVLCGSPKECLQGAFRLNLIEEEEIFIAMLKDRNLTAHIYDEEEAAAIYQRIVTLHLPTLQRVLPRLKQ